MSEDQTTPTTTPAPEADPAPKKKQWRFWLADPRHETRIKLPGQRKLLSFRNGTLVVNDAKTAAIVRRSMRGKAFEEDWPADKPAIMCPHCGYAPRSFDAARLHPKVHPVGEGL